MFMKKTILSLTMLAIAVPTLLTSCATIFGKSSYPVSINSNPNGATVSVGSPFLVQFKNRIFYSFQSV